MAVAAKIAGEPAQTVRLFGWLVIAGTAWMVTTRFVEVALQGDSCPVVVSVSVTVPADLSASDGLYVAFSVVASGVSVPVPEEVQVPPVAPPLTAPPRPAVLWLAQIVWLPPVLATAALCTVTTTCAVCAVQVDRSPVEVSVSVTVPAVASAAVGA